MDADRSEELGRRMEGHAALEPRQRHDIEEVQCLPDLNEHLQSTSSGVHIRWSRSRMQQALQEEDEETVRRVGVCC